MIESDELRESLVMFQKQLNEAREIAIGFFSSNLLSEEDKKEFLQRLEQIDDPCQQTEQKKERLKVQLKYQLLSLMSGIELEESSPSQMRLRATMNETWLDCRLEGQEIELTTQQGQSFSLSED